jgi:FkbM family methyltransferase
MKFSSIVRTLSDDFRIVLADVGSAGGLHKRWAPIRRHVSAILFDPLEESAGGGNDRYFPVALGREAGRAMIHVTKRVSMTSALSPNSALLSRFWDKPEHTEIVSQFEVATSSLDDVAAANGLRLDVLKIDVQGGEYEILEGARRALRDVFLLEVELSFFERYVGLKPFDAVVGLMREFGFELIDVSRIKRYRYRNSFGVVNPGLGLGDRAGRLAFCDALFLQTDDALLGRMKSGDGSVALKAILTMLVYGKADIAAFLFDHASTEIPMETRAVLSEYLSKLGGRRFEKASLHHALDYFARKV